MIRLSAALLALSASPSLAQDVSYELVNQTGLTLMEFHPTPASKGSSDDNDLLVAGFVAPGEVRTVTIPDTGGECSFNFRTIFEDGSVVEETHDICATSSYTLTQ